jgi:antirestriction protein ArdC
MSMKYEIGAWDYKTMPVIRSVYGNFSKRPTFVKELVHLMGGVKTEVGASWLLKHHLDNQGEGLTEQLIDDLYAQINGLTHWGARLHILQCMSRMPIPEKHLDSVEEFLGVGTEDTNKFVRAWTYAGIHALATQHASYREEATEMIEEAALADGAASVRARCHKLLEQGFVGAE